MPRLITLGETMVLVTPAQADPLETAEDVLLRVGGAESNVAIHAVALGIPAAWVGALGADSLGRRVQRSIAAHGVDLRWVKRDQDAQTGVYFKDPGRGVSYYRRGSAASRLTPAEIAEVPFEAAEVVHLSGITPALSRSCAAVIDSVIDRVAAGSGRLSFDVNHRSVLWSSDAGADWHPGAAALTLLALSRRADLVFVGLDEAEGLWGCRTVDEVRELLPEPSVLVVKDGAVGATEFSGSERTFVPAIPTSVVEPVGAGDAFAAGYLAALLTGADATGRLRSGHQRAHLVLQSTSDVLP